MLYLLDANVLINANNFYYPIHRVPEYWSWLIHNGEQNNIKIPIETYEEIKGGKDQLAKLAKNQKTKSALLLDEEALASNVSYIIDNGYATDLTDDEVTKLGRDPLLLSYALTDKASRCIVTAEASKPSKIRANRHIPDVCNSLEIFHINSFDLLAKLNFSTSWTK